MHHTIASYHGQNLRVKLSHPNVGDNGEGSITFGYSSLARFVLDGLGREISLNAAQLPEEAVTYVGDAYFEDETQTEQLHSTVFVDLARVPI